MVVEFTKIKLYHKEILVEELLNKLPDYGGISRIITLIKFKTSLGEWSKSYEALIDTGAHISVIPSNIWISTRYEWLATHKMYGIVPREECELPVDIGKLICVLIDREGNFSNAIEIRAYLAPSDEIPLVIGFKDLLEKFKLNISVPEDEYYLEEF
ncbi:MAG: hypothetical protein ACE5J9_07165 [Methanosarcinales archaeon]